MKTQALTTLGDIPGQTNWKSHYNPLLRFQIFAWLKKGTYSIAWGCIHNLYHPAHRVCNANMDGRDIVCIMPTGECSRNLYPRSSQYAGGGKSLTYQLPAICQPGLTLVVCPLISLMADQILYLREKNSKRIYFISSDRLSFVFSSSSRDAFWGDAPSYETRNHATRFRSRDR